METVEKIFPVIFIVLSILLAATTRSLTEFEVVVFQILSLFCAIVGSYIFGRRTSIGKMNELVEPYARPAFRRLISLFKSLSRVAQITESDKYDDSTKLDIINVIVIEQIATASDALADWGDIVPDSVEELKKGMNLDDI